MGTNVVSEQESIRVTWHLLRTTEVTSWTCEDVVEINSTCVHICSYFQVIYRHVSWRGNCFWFLSHSKDIWITFNSDCCGDNCQILSVLRPPPTHPRGYIGFPLCFESRFVLSVVFSVGSEKMWTLWLFCVSGTDLGRCATCTAVFTRVLHLNSWIFTDRCWVYS